MMRIAIYIVILTLSSLAFGQKLNSEVSESQLLIGQPITLTYSVKFTPTDSLSFSPKIDAIQVRTTTNSGSLSSEGIEFEITDEFRDTFIVEKNYKEWIGQYVITSWDSGLYIIPGPSVIINDSTFSFKDLTIECHLVDPVDGVDIYDIKEGFADIPPKPFSLIQFLLSNWWWVLLIILGIGVFIYIRKKRKAEPEEEQKPVSLKERTLIAIEALEKAKLWEKEQLKEHFVELSFILRSYLTSRYDISLLEKTTHETKLLLTQKGLNDETVKVISRILSESDMVKFAKSKPDVISILRVSTLAKQIVAETSPLEFDNVE